MVHAIKNFNEVYLKYALNNDIFPEEYLFSDEVREALI